jgi:filamentous hemagglutinin
MTLIPGIDKPFTSPTGQPPNPKALVAMGRITISQGIDCSEIAEDILSGASSQGLVLRVEPSVGNQLILLEEGELRREFFYHEVYTDGKYVFDPRLSSQPVLLEEWKILMEYLNPGMIIQ